MSTAISSSAGDVRTASRSEEFLVITSVNGRSRSRIWDSRRPLALGHPMRWILEKNGDGTYSVRDVGGRPQEILTDAVVRLTEKEIASGTTVSLPDGRTGRASRAQIKIERVRPIRPAFVTADPTAVSDPQTFVFAGVRKTLISSAAVQAGYAAYAGTNPAFTVHPTANGFKVKPLADHLTLNSTKGRGQAQGMSVALIPKEALNLSRDELLSATINTGQYWWRFGLVSNPGGFRATHDEPFLREDASRFKRAFGIAAALYLLLLLFMWMMPATTKEEKPEEEKPVVKFEQPKRPIITQEPIHRPDPVAGQTEPAPAAATAEPIKSDDQAKVEPPKAKEIVKEPSKELPKQALEPVAQPEKSKTATSRPLKKALDIAKKANAAVAKVVKSAAQVASEARSRMLKDIMGAAAVTMGKKTKLETAAEASGGSQSAANSIGRIGSADSAMAPTEVKPGVSGSGVRVAKTGGGSDAGKTGSVGYSGGEHAAVQGQGGSFVAVSPKGATVEEGLTKEEVGAVIHAHMGEIRYCHESAMLAHPDIQGKLMLQFVINASGVVESVGVQSTTLPEQKLSDCVMNKLRAWRFPHPKRGVKVAVAYPFIFKTLGRE